MGASFICYQESSFTTMPSVYQKCQWPLLILQQSNQLQAKFKGHSFAPQWSLQFLTQVQGTEMA